VTLAFARPVSGQPWQNSLGMKFAPVSGTEVLFGIWDVRVQDYRAYAEANTSVDRSWKNPGFAQGDTHPVVNVSWNDAKAFCQWLTEQERAAGLLTASQSYRLPTDAEWSVAVGLEGESGSTPAKKDRKIKGVYPWGTQWPPPNGAGNYATSLGVDNFAYTSPVGSFAANQFGLYDMGGNAWQCCEDWYNSNQTSRVLRGASWFDRFPSLLLSSYRDDRTPDYRNNCIGFRVVLGGASSR
jgi:formylglycine-generating enzyme required for sulfatase activity